MARPPLRHKPPHRPHHEETEKVAGLPAVKALFAHAPDRAERLFFDDRLAAEAGPFCKLLAARHKPYRKVPTDELTKIAGSPLHGGILCVARPKPIPLFDVEDAKGWTTPLVILDGVGNPHNLGAIARTMAFFGLDRLVVSDHPGQALPSEAAFRVAEGGLEWVQVYRAPKLPQVLKRLRAHYRVVGTALGAHRPLDAVLAKGDKPLAVVLGNEEEGLPPATQAACDEVATIPGSGKVQSLNVAATAAILVHLLAAGR
ncbi:MAG TPA: RNA methyltransferase [Candidatus Omnitrophota bacterium]|nr:RNA methyltransferase [Candidatus Omnitrophota bacterium]